MAKKKEHIVYRYCLKETKEVIYVGKTDVSLKSRVDAHEKESKFLPYRGKWYIEYIVLANFVETDVVEKFLINKWKPVLNEKDCVAKVTDYLAIQLPRWQPYENYQHANKARFSILYAEAVAKEDLIQKLMQNHTTIVTHLPNSPFLLPYECKLKPYQIIQPEVVYTGHGYQVEASLEWIKLEPVVKMYYDRVSFAIWEPVAKCFSFNETDNAQLGILKNAELLAYELEEYYDNRFDQGLGFEKGFFETTLWKNEMKNWGFSEIICDMQLYKDNTYVMEVPPFEKEVLYRILNNIAKEILQIYKHKFQFM